MTTAWGSAAESTVLYHAGTRPVERTRPGYPLGRRCMASHHYVPQFILRNFASADKPGANRLVTVFEKRRGTYRRLPPRRVCCLEGANALAVQPDALARGLLYYVLSLQRGQPPTVRNLKELKALGASDLSPVDPEVVEGDLGKLDSRVAHLANQGLRSRRPLDPAEIRTLSTAVFLSRTRSPAFLDTYYPGLRDGALGEARARLPPEMVVAAREEAAEVGKTLEDLFAPFEQHLHQWTLMHYVANGVASLAEAGGRIAVLHAPGGAEFVTGDNAARPILLGGVENSIHAACPALRNPGAFMAMPLGPDICVVLGLAPEGTDGAHIDVSSAMVRRINTATLVAARETVVSVDSDPTRLFEPWVLRRGKLRRLPPIRWP